MFTLGLVRCPPTTTKEIQYVNAKGALTYADIAGDPVLYCFFQAEEGIRDDLVTGVQTCALPIWPGTRHARTALTRQCAATGVPNAARARAAPGPPPPSAPGRWHSAASERSAAPHRAGRTWRR